MITIIPSGIKDSKERHPQFHGVPMLDSKGNILPDGKYFFDKEKTVIVCIYHGLIDGRGNSGEGSAGGWAIQHKDGHTEWWRSGYPYNSEETLPAVISEFGTWEEYWNRQHELVKIVQNDVYLDLIESDEGGKK